MVRSIRMLVAGFLLGAVVGACGGWVTALSNPPRGFVAVAEDSTVSHVRSLMGEGAAIGSGLGALTATAILLIPRRTS